jgi:beta-N-acetylglucosaminidase
MRKIAPYIVRACKKENVDIKLITAIAILESGWGTSRIAKEKKNYFGLSCYDWDPSGSALDFSKESIEDAILESVQIIKRDYLSNNWTLEQIGQKYCPTNPRWAKIIKEIMEEIEY